MWTSSYIYIFKYVNVLSGRDPFLRANVHKGLAAATSPGYRCFSQTADAAVQRSTTTLFEVSPPLWTLLCCRLFKIFRFTNRCSAVLCIATPPTHPPTHPHVPPLNVSFAWQSALTHGSHKSNRAQIMNLFFGCKASAYSPSVIVSAGVDGNTPKTSFVCDEHPHPPETKGTVRNEKLILLCPDKHVIRQQTSLPGCYKCTAKKRVSFFPPYYFLLLVGSPYKSFKCKL